MNKQRTRKPQPSLSCAGNFKDALEDKMCCLGTGDQLFTCSPSPRVPEGELADGYFGRSDRCSFKCFENLVVGVDYMYGKGSCCFYYSIHRLIPARSAC